MCRASAETFAVTTKESPGLSSLEAKAGRVKADFKEAQGYLLALIGTILAVLNQGYSAFSADHEEYFAQAFREFYPNFALNDWFVWDNVHFHVGFTKLLLVLLHLGAVESGLFLVWLACVGWQFVCYFHIIKACGGRPWQFALFILIWAAVGPEGAGETRPVSNILVPSMLGFTFMIGSVERLVREKPYQAGILAGLAGLFHIAFAVVGFPVLLAVMLAGSGENRTPRRLAGTVTLALLAASPTLVWTALNTGLTEQGLDSIYMLRSPHHTDPTYFPARAWLSTIAVLLLGIATPLANEPLERRAGRQVKALIVAVSAILALSYLSFILEGPAALVRIVPWRFTSLGMLASYLLLCASAERHLWPGLTLAAVPFIGAYFGTPIPPALLSATCLGGAWWVANRYQRKSVWLTVSLALALIFFLKADQLKSPRYFTLKASLPAAEWFREHTPPGSIVLTPPDQVTFRIVSHRAAYNTFKCFSVLNRKLSEQWIERLKKQAGLDPLEPFPVPLRSYYLEWFLAGRYLNLPPQYLASLADQNGCAYILLPRSRMVLMLGDQGPQLTVGELNPAIPPGLETLGWRLLYQDRDYLIYGRTGTKSL